MSKQLLVTVDSLRYDHFDYLENTREFLTSTHDRAFAVSTATPGSFPGILAGEYPSPGGITPHSEFVSALDCYSVGISTNHLLSQRYGYGESFDYFESPDPSKAGLKDKIARSVPEGSSLRRVLAAGWNTYQRVASTISNPGRTFRPAQDVIATLLNKVEQHEDWFGWIHLMEPHHPYEPSLGDFDRVKAQNASRRVLDGNGSDRDVEIVLAAYKQELRELDTVLTKLWGQLPEDTEILFTADHGELLGENYSTSWGHPGEMLPELLHVPLGTRNLSIPEGKVISLIDIGTIFTGSPYRGGQQSREFAYASYGDSKAVLTEDYLYDGTVFRPIGSEELKTTPPEDASTMAERWKSFNPDKMTRQDGALEEDLKNLGYL